MGEMRYSCAPNAHPLVVEAMVLLERTGRDIVDVCERAGIDPGTVANWRRGRNTPNVFMILLVLQELGYELAIAPLPDRLPHASTWLTKNTPGY